MGCCQGSENNLCGGGRVCPRVQTGWTEEERFLASLVTWMQDARQEIPPAQTALIESLENWRWEPQPVKVEEGSSSHSDLSCEEGLFMVSGPKVVQLNGLGRTREAQIGRVEQIQEARDGCIGYRYAGEIKYFFSISSTQHFQFSRCPKFENI